jgi:hypothetical protein
LSLCARAFQRVFFGLGATFVDFRWGELALVYGKRIL